jgi:tRNA (guanine-N(7)-)-methyltransferase subunit TRM82
MYFRTCIYICILGWFIGNVRRYPIEAREILPPPPKPQNSLGGRKSLVAHYNPSDGTLVLGHASLLTAMALTQDEKYIITADRDEHIRVSHYPEGYDIERFCLGHTK